MFTVLKLAEPSTYFFETTLIQFKIKILLRSNDNFKSKSTILMFTCEKIKINLIKLF